MTSRAAGLAILGMLALTVAAPAIACPPGHALARPSAAELSEGEALYLPTPQRVVDAMLRLANVGPDDVLYDLGSGDGRIPITAARRFAIRAVGIELDARKIAEARCNARESGVEQRVEFRQADVFEADFREASVVTLFLFPEMILRLRPRLRAELAPGTRIVSHRFDLGDWPPDQRAEVDGHAIFLWIVPPRGTR
ncbi:MAG: methyltransferase domain-containing protein [Burkholderiales bacterium]